jgi:glucan phosphoethanolaminetransferase (alkaline phosphatase superfamily)
MFFVQSVYFPYTGLFFSFNLVALAGEGSSYILDTVLHAPWYVYAVAVLVLLLAILAIVKFPKRESTGWKDAGILIALFFVLHALAPMFYGPANNALKWDTWRNPHNVYQNFNDSNKSMKVCGLYEYTIRDFYKTFLKKSAKASPEEKEFLDETYKTEIFHQENGYTGILEGKNVIFLQLLRCQF